MNDLLRYGVLTAAVISLFSLFFLLAKTILVGKRPAYSKSQGNSVKGIIYALSLGLAPWEKESASRHLPTYIAGILYHLGIFSALAYILTIVFDLIRFPLRQSIFQVLLSVGIICGTGLLIKRISLKPMRSLSRLDDYFSNILVDIFLISALLDSFFPEIRPFFLITAILLFLYIPLGKIRHCFFFFYSRILFGRYYGRRGVLTHKKHIRGEPI